MNRAVFLDRDNTIVQAPQELTDPSQVQLIQGAASAIASLRGLGYRIIVVSNQPAVAFGQMTEEDVQAVNNRISQLAFEISNARIDRFYFCPFHPEASVEHYRADHPWRKPHPGMWLQAAKDLDLDLSQCWTVGDSLHDIQAGAAAGTRTILLTPHADPTQPPLLQERAAARILGRNGSPPPVMPDFVARNLVEAVRIIAQQRRPETLVDWAALQRAEARAAAPQRLEPQPLRPTAVPQPTPAAASPPARPPASSTTTPAPEPAAEPASAPLAAPTSPAAPSQTPPPPAVESPSRTPPSPAVSPSAEPAPAAPREDWSTLIALLRQILQELRSSRAAPRELGALDIMAIVCQALAVICLLAGLWLGPADSFAFFRWLGAGLLVQLIAIALLLFRR